MNGNCFSKSLRDGLGRPACKDMLEALGLDDRDEFDAPPRPIQRKLGDWNRTARKMPRAANCNLRVAV
jgi:hypothetical protein